MKNIDASIETLLFAYGAPIGVAKLAKLLGISSDECRTALAAFGGKLAADPSRGLVLVLNGDEVALATKPELKELLESLMKGEFQETLTPAALETLSLVAYLGPVVRAEVDYIRGVNSSFTLRSLLIRGLIERSPAEKGGGYVYQASIDFLKHMGLTDVGQLPEYEKYRTFYQQFAAALNEPQIAEPAPIPIAEQ